MIKKAAPKDRARSKGSGTLVDRKTIGRKKLPVGSMINLSANEIEIIMKACTKYRHMQPTYLASKQEEIGLIDQILEKLSNIGERN